MSEDNLKVGQRVRLIHDSSSIGVITGKIREYFTVSRLIAAKAVP